MNFLLAALPADLWNPKSQASKQLSKRLADLQVDASMALPTCKSSSRKAPKAFRVFVCEVTGCAKTYKSFGGLVYHMEHAHGQTSIQKPREFPLWDSISLDSESETPPASGDPTTTTTSHSMRSALADPVLPALLPAPLCDPGHASQPGPGGPTKPPGPLRDVFGTFPMEETLCLAKCPHCQDFISAPFYFSHTTTCPKARPDATSSHSPSEVPAATPPALVPIVPQQRDGSSPPSIDDPGGTCLSPLSWRERAQLRQLTEPPERRRLGPPRTYKRKHRE